jgi:hypothetical protein
LRGASHDNKTPLSSETAETNLTGSGFNRSGGNGGPILPQPKKPHNITIRASSKKKSGNKGRFINPLILLANKIFYFA